MTEQDKQKESLQASDAKPKDAAGPQNLISEFGAPAKKEEDSATASAQPLPPHLTPPTSFVRTEEAERNDTSAQSTVPPQRETPSEPKNAPQASKKSTSSANKKSSASKKAGSKKNKAGRKTAYDQVINSTASPNKGAKKGAANPKVQLEGLPRSVAKPAHRILPYVYLIFAVFIFVSLLLNLFCNPENVLESNPSAHPMGVVGYGICYGLFGLFGPAVFVLPFLLVNLALYWKRYIDHGIAISKILTSVFFQVMLSALIHIFCLTQLSPADRNLTAEFLMQSGAKMQAGGLVGGLVGAFFVRYLNITGALIVDFCLLAASLFYFVGMTPQHLWERIRMRRHLASDRTPGATEQNAEYARNRAQMEEKIRRSTTRQMTVSDSDSSEAPEGAVQTVKPAKKEPKDKLAPMPMPNLAPNDGSEVFISTEISQKMKEQREKERAEAAKAAADASAKRAEEARQQATGTPPSPAKTSNSDAAMEPIFPRAVEAKQARRTPKEDRNFDLRNIFIEFEEPVRPQARRHAPVPPEVPLKGDGTAAAKAAQAQAQTQARPAGQTKPAASASSVTGATPQRPRPAAGASMAGAHGATAPTNKGTNPTGNIPLPTVPKPTAQPAVHNEQTVFRKAPEEGNKKFGLSDAEFEQIEARQTKLSKTGASSAKKEPAKPAPTAAKKEAGSKPAPAPAKVVKKKYVFPPISYLHPGEPMTADNIAEIQESMQNLADTFSSFHVGIKEINYTCGPTVTRYEVTPAPGVRVRSTVNLSDDSALSLASGGIRMEAPIPNKNAVGVEVPNRTRCTVYLRDLLESKDFINAGSKLTSGLGADVSGAPLLFDLAKMPHLLVAGTTGSGKSVCINCIIMSLLYKATPDEVKLVLIDPKKVEFGIYKNIPHLMAPIVTTPKDAAGALQAGVEEMERRFELFEQVGVKDLKGYNAITKDDPDMPELPQIVIIIDELADLMMTAPDEVETAICRIAQKARAAGMHLIIGTQRPSVDVVTGLIKSNVPSRIAFTVSSQVDSRTILDSAGAEKLAGRGDMLFVPIGAMKPTRVQGAYVDEKEVEKICDFIRATNGIAQYDERFISKLKELAAQCGNKGKGGGGGGGDSLPGADGKDGDNKYADAVRVAVEEGRISTSLLQRKLEVGYSRAAKLIDRMQEEGLVSPPDGSKARSILITPEQYIERFIDGASKEKNSAEE